MVTPPVALLKLHKLHGYKELVFLTPPQIILNSVSVVSTVTRPLSVGFRFPEFLKANSGHRLGAYSERIIVVFCAILIRFASILFNLSDAEQDAPIGLERILGPMLEG